MLSDLLRLDLTQFNIRKVPQTEALQEQTLQSLRRHRLWSLDELRAGDWWEDAGPGQSACVNKASMAEDFSRECLKTFSHGAKTKLGMMLKRVLPTGWPQTQVLTKGKSSAGFFEAGEHYLLPPLAEARAHFELVTGLCGLFEDAECAPVSNAEDLPDLPNLFSMSEERKKRGRARGGQQTGSMVGKVG
jgi:hypothetical protein